jgi:amino acid transporter
VALLLFLFFRQHAFSELFQHLGTGTAPNQTAAFLAAIAIAGWAFIGFDACSTIAEETHEPKRMVPRAIFFFPLYGGKCGALQLRRPDVELQPRHTGEYELLV